MIFKSDPNALFFSLKNEDYQSGKMKQINATKSIYSDPGYSPIFGLPIMQIHQRVIIQT
jgi:hypothetical protein